MPKINNFQQHKERIWQKRPKLPQQLHIRVYPHNRNVRICPPFCSRPVQCTEGETRARTVSDNSYLSKPDCHSPYPVVDVLADSGPFRGEAKCAGDRKRLNLNGDFPRENEYLIETNCLPTRGITTRSFKVGERDNRDGTQDKGGPQGEFFFCQSEWLRDELVAVGKFVGRLRKINESNKRDKSPKKVINYFNKRFWYILSDTT